ncbi:MAG: HPF/RaiA family ribosome-associated protein [bacterium]|jgi:cold shock CspA family protein
MQVPLEIHYRNVVKTPEIENLIREKAEKLERVCDHIISCRVAVEKPQEFQKSGNPYRVRLDIRVPPEHEIIINRDYNNEEMHLPVETVIRNAFRVAWRRLEDLVQKQQGVVKSHAGEQAVAYVVSIFPEKGYGFIQSPFGYEVYFHKNSVLNGEFDNLDIGSPVRYVEAEGEKGPQASTVEVLPQSITKPLV